jgi:hypothetical protein
MVFGVISANISKTIVSPAVAIAIPVSPQSLIAITVAIEDARILTKLLPIKITLISWSVRLSSLLAFIAPLCPLFLRCFSLYLFSESIPVSALEKKAENIIKRNKKIKSVEIGVSLNL